MTCTVIWRPATVQHVDFILACRYYVCLGVLCRYVKLFIICKRTYNIIQNKIFNICSVLCQYEYKLALGHRKPFFQIFLVSTSRMAYATCRYYLFVNYKYYLNTEYYYKFVLFLEVFFYHSSPVVLVLNILFLCLFSETEPFCFGTKTILSRCTTILVPLHPPPRDPRISFLGKAM